MKLLEKYKKYLTPINFVTSIIVLVLFILPLVLGVAPTGKWWAYVVYLIVWVIVGLIFFYPQKLREWYRKIFK